MAAKYIQKFATTAAFLAASPDRGAAQGFGFVSDVLYANIAGVAVAIPTQRERTETLVTTRVLTAADSGKQFFLALAGGFTVSLPPVATSAGLKFKFTATIAPTTAYIIQTDASEQKLAGLVFSGAGADEDSEVDITGTNINFVANTAVIGDSCEVWSDGVGWYSRSFCNATGGITITG